MLTIILLVELAVLYFLSRRVTVGLFQLFLLMFRVRAIAVTILLILEFPGTVVHELSHLFTAGILGVRTGKLSFEPESIRDQNIQAGSVMIEQTDPFRRYLIGLAPLFSGIVILTAVAFFLPGLFQNSFQSGTPVFQNPQFYILIALGYLLFAISNSMFSSSQDLKGFIPFAIVIAIFAITFYVIGIRIQLTGAALDTATKILTSLVKSLGVVLGVNIILLILTRIITTGISRLTHARVVKA